MLNKTVITVGIDRRPWGLSAAPWALGQPRPVGGCFRLGRPTGRPVAPGLEYLPTLAAGRDVGERERNQNSSIKGPGGTVCSHMTISRINPSGHFRPQLG